MTHQNAFLKAIKLFVAIGGLIIVLLSSGCGLFYYVSPMLSSTETALDGTVMGTAVLVLGGGLGAALAWHSFNAFRLQPAASFRLPSFKLLLLIYIPVLVIGQLIIVYDWFPTITFPPFHVVAAATPPLLILAFVTQALKRTDIGWREMILQLSGGAFLATTIAFISEIVIGFIILILAIMITGLSPEGLASIEELAQNMQDPFWLENPANIQSLLFFPPIAITLIIVFALIAPIIEEIVKPLGVTLMGYRRPTEAQIFIWGLAGGAGFALAENLFNTLLSLDAWAYVLLMRIGATVMHCLGSGIIALGWHRFQTQRRFGRLLGAYGLSIFTHILWNSAVIGLVAISMWVTDSPEMMTQTVAGLAVISILGFFGLLTIGLIVALVLLTRRLRANLPPQTPEEPLYPEISTGSLN